MPMAFLSKVRLLLVAHWPVLLLIAIAFLTYAPSLGNGFVTWDDELLITLNPVAHGLSIHNIRMAFTMFDPELYIPLTFLSFQLNFALHGLQPLGYHLGNLLLHIGSVLLVYRIVRQLTGRQIAALATALFFAVHPLHAEAVAWASARKDVLAAFFALGAVTLLLDWRQTRAPKSYAASLLSFLLALLAKVHVLVLPLLLPCLAIAQGRRLGRRTLLTTIPFLTLSVTFGIVALVGKSGRNTGILWEKMLIGMKAAVFTLEKLLVPTGLSVLYPYTKPISLFTPDLLVSALLVLTITLICLLPWVFSSRSPIPYSRIPLLLWFSFLLLLAPSFTNVAKGHDALRDVYFFSDRYAYLASLIPLGIAGWCIDLLWQRRRMLGIGALSAVTIVFALLAWRQSLTWRDTESLFRSVLRAYPNSHVALGNVGAILYQRGERQKALEYYQASLKVRPNSAAYFNLGVAAEESGLTARAEEFYRKAVEQRPWDAQALTRLGLLMLKRGATAEAVDLLLRAIDAKATPVEAFTALGRAYAKLGQMDKSHAAYEEALRIDPENAEAAGVLGVR
ncbi:MAG: hypothetical protein G01um101425_1028 [Candidatus Peregrinibacteria bacterium Gr01-1014_25]|nr:MAG: hypothetical protein G01um101425_1028 [Candidatus Peregrinibacteria bacterium Gr01-1014_25]